MLTWDRYVNRRKINVSLWMKYHRISSFKHFCEVCEGRGVQPASEDAFMKFFQPVDNDVPESSAVVEDVQASHDEVEEHTEQPVDSNEVSEHSEADDTSHENARVVELEEEGQEDGYEVDNSGFLVVKKRNPFKKK